MNEEIKIKPQVVSPLKKICMTIGELPSSYLETMTYYEMLVWFTNFLRDQIIPVVNNNGEAVSELQNLYLDLQNYVNGYFDNLDVQEEINNKLDEMAESGQLADIIAQYLGLAGIIGFDDVNDMKEATNLVNGSKCQTLGFNYLNDGKGSLYRVRTITNEDVIDNEKIIPLHDNTLIAEKIDKFIKENNCLLKLHKIDNGETYNLILSKSYDGIYFEKIMILNGIEIPHNDRNVAVNFCYINDRFYVLTSLGYWYSKDLLNWSEMKTFNVTISGPSIYKNKLYGHFRESTTQIPTIIGNSYPFSIKSYDITFNDDGTINLSNEITMLQGDSTHSYIDPDVKEYKNKTYFVCKDEVNVCIKLYKLNNGVLEITDFAHRGIGIEACKLIPTDTNLYIYADPYHLQTNYENTNNLNFPRDISVRMTAINDEIINTDSLLTEIHGGYDYHPAYNIISDLKGVNIINSLQYTPNLELNTRKFRNYTFTSTEDNAKVSIINHPTYLLNIYGNTKNKIAYLRFTKIFEDSPAYISIDKSVQTIIHPAQGINDNTSDTSTDIILNQNKIISAPVSDKPAGSFIFLPTEGNTFANKFKNLETNVSLFTSLTHYFTKNNTTNFFYIAGYNTDISVNLLPTASNFFGIYFKYDDNNGIVMLYRQGNVIREYRTTISGGTIAEWTTIHSS